MQTNINLHDMRIELWCKGYEYIVLILICLHHGLSVLNLRDLVSEISNKQCGFIQVIVFMYLNSSF